MEIYNTILTFAGSIGYALPQQSSKIGEAKNKRKQ